MIPDATSTPFIRVALYDDCPEMRNSISTLLAAFPGFTLLGAYPDARHILENCAYRKPDVILMDIDMPHVSGIEATAQVHARYPDIKVLMLTVFDDNFKVFHSICNGAVGYILKKADAQEILNAVQEAHTGGAPMTPVIATKVLRMFRDQAPPMEEQAALSDKELDILTLLTRGYSYKMIAADRQISIDTVRFYIKKIYEKLHVHSMTEAVSKALKNKWV